MKPGPATETSVTASSAESFAARRSARSRGFIPAGLASTIAALVDRVAMRGIARRLDGDARDVDPGRQHALFLERRLQGSLDAILEAAGKCSAAAGHWRGQASGRAL